MNNEAKRLDDDILLDQAHADLFIRKCTFLLEI